MLTNFEAQIVDTIKKAISSYKPPAPLNSTLKSSQLTIKGPCLKVLELDIKIDNICLKDRFEWDINDESNNP
jgi:hypothetical protein